MDKNNEKDKKEFVELEIKPDSTLKKIFMSISRWVLLVLGLIFIGALIVFFTLYNPAKQKIGIADTNLENAREIIISHADQIASLQTENAILERNLKAANETIINQDVEIVSLQTNLDNTLDKNLIQTDQIALLEIENESLQIALDSVTLHFDLVNSLSGLRGASLAVATNDYVGARLFLVDASQALDTLSGRLGANQKDVFIAMQKSASLALIDLQKNLKSAQPELDQLTNNLLQLEDNLFPTP